MSSNKDNTNEQIAPEDLTSFLNGLADKIQNKLDETSTDINKKLEEMNTRINRIEKTLKQMHDNNSN
ncbi:hypothetical protein CU097_004233 [Rhizopus azygosporus]|uniref:Uncharacterized protein n=2 Tax=Rhizopus TaxID=4842 RepID=A0A367J2R3_RHIAZ|nr:hypothetical protein BCV71DRAFT_261144 [Rhizopus microsporus]RCH84228.1 hypothetical protein CU097_004233 [Rhizopus azygosporus]